MPLQGPDTPDMISHERYSSADAILRGKFPCARYLNTLFACHRVLDIAKKC